MRNVFRKARREVAAAATELDTTGIKITLQGCKWARCVCMSEGSILC